MTSVAPSPVPTPDQLRIHPGPALLAGIADGPSLEAHRARYGPLPRIRLDDLLEQVGRLALRGRGGAAFPFATKLQAAARGRRPVVVVNLSEGEPASAKDAALALTRPHLVLDGAIATAVALGAREVHLVLPGDRPAPQRRMRQAVDERDDGVRLRTHTADARFVAGQARAVVELMGGRANLPVTSWAPEAVDGHRGRPTLLSNAETWAQVGLLLHAGEAAYRRLGTPSEPGTTLLTFSRSGLLPEVREVPFGTPIREVLPVFAQGLPALVGGFHGAWATAETLAGARVSVGDLAALGLPLGAGVVHVPQGCPLVFTSSVVDYLAGQSAGRCGPCLNGLPALADAVRGIVHGHDTMDRIDQLSRLLERRGACAHPDGTVRMVHSLFVALPEEIAAHRRGDCLAASASLALRVDRAVAS
jgi:NADH:ubiquinone oxidoreductase subunit F (NADH-binding)